MRLFLKRAEQAGAALHQAVFGLCFSWWEKERQQQNGIGRVVVF
jgi:hypothetical protein